MLLILFYYDSKIKGLSKTRDLAIKQGFNTLKYKFYLILLSVIRGNYI